MPSNDPKSLQDVIGDGGNIGEVLRNAQNDACALKGVLSGYSNRRLELRTWRESAVLLDQTHHADDVILCAPDAMRLIGDTAIDSVANFDVDVAAAIL